MARDINRDWALRLAEAGLSVFPCGPDKKPLVTWRSASTSDTRAVSAMWSAHPGALPAIDCGKAGLVVLDGDRHGGPDGVAALRQLLADQPAFNKAATPAASTPGNGVHVFFRCNGQALGNARGELPAGIDVRGDGGYVIAPYAQLGDGRSYRAAPGTPDLISAFSAGEVPEVPPGVVALLTARRHRKADTAIPTTTTRQGGVRERTWAEAALDGCAAELAATAAGGAGGGCAGLMSSAVEQLDEILRRYEAMPEDRRKALLADAQTATRGKLWLPNPGPQTVGQSAADPRAGFWRGTGSK